MRTTVDIDAELLRRLRLEAHRRGIPFKTVLAGALRRGLDTVPSEETTRYRLPTFSMGTPDPAYDIDKALAVAAVAEDEEVVRKLSFRK